MRPGRLTIATTSGITLPAAGTVATADVTIRVHGNSQDGGADGNSEGLIGLATLGLMSSTALTYMPAAGAATTDVRFGFTYNKRLDVGAHVQLLLTGFTGNTKAAGTFQAAQVRGRDALDRPLPAGASFARPTTCCAPCQPSRV